VYGSAKIGWHMSVTGGDLDMRVFEVMCSGRPLVTDDARESGLWDIVPIVQCGATYDSETEMYRMIDWVHREPGLAAQMGRAGRQIAMDLHTYRHRARQLLQAVGL
jgi:spore maturation protein CgeB